MRELNKIKIIAKKVIKKERGEGKEELVIEREIERE